MPNTVSLGLPLLVAEQAQKHVTHNEALRALDALVQLSVKDRDLASPPDLPADGDRYIVASSPTGVWAGHAADIAVWQDGAWDFHDRRRTIAIINNIGISKVVHEPDTKFAA